MKSISLSFKNLLTRLKKTTFSYKCLKKNPKQFFHLTGLCVEDFDCLFACVEAYISAITYPNCKTHQQRKLTKRTELMCFMIICRHTLPLGITGYMTGTSASTQSSIFTAWAVFLSTLFDQLDLIPCPGEVPGILCIWPPGHSVAGRLHKELDLLNWKTLTSAMQHSVHAKTMTLAKLEFG